MTFLCTHLDEQIINIPILFTFNNYQRPRSGLNGYVYIRINDICRSYRLLYEFDNQMYDDSQDLHRQG